MRVSQGPLLAASVLLGVATARDIPTNVETFYKSIVKQGECNNVLVEGFHSSDNDSGDFSYCGDHITDYNVVYIQGKKGQLANMDIDCDGIQGSAADDGRCGSSSDTQSQTSFMDTVNEYDSKVKDLDANIHPYVVFGNTGKRKNYTNFDPTKYGIEPLSVMAVVCNKKLIYGVWGDENGDDGPEAMVGEVSISLATACFGKSMNGDNGHDENDVLYIAFPGSDAVPGKKADWAAKNYTQFEDSITALGDKLVERIKTNSSNCTGSYCEGPASCYSNSDCSYGLICSYSKCVPRHRCS